MGKILDYIKGIVADSAGTPSSKRVIAVVFSILIGIAFVANLGWGLSVDDNILDAVMMVVIAGLGFTGVEKFAPRKSQEPEPGMD
jgi:hypothetical protein